MPPIEAWEGRMKNLFWASFWTWYYTKYPQSPEGRKTYLGTCPWEGFTTKAHRPRGKHFRVARRMTNQSFSRSDFKWRPHEWHWLMFQRCQKCNMGNSQNPLSFTTRFNTISKFSHQIFIVSWFGHLHEWHLLFHQILIPTRYHTSHLFNWLDDAAINCLWNIRGGGREREKKVGMEWVEKSVNKDKADKD